LQLRKLIESKAALEGLLSILCRDHEDAFLVLNSMCALSRAPGFAKQVRESRRLFVLEVYFLGSSEIGRRGFFGRQG
jgi:hypothetical protein